MSQEKVGHYGKIAETKYQAWIGSIYRELDIKTEAKCSNGKSLLKVVTNLLTKSKARLWKITICNLLPEPEVQDFKRPYETFHIQ